MVAGVLTLPPGWTGQSQVVWNYAHYSQPLQVYARVQSGDGSLAVEFFPVQQYTWIEPNMMGRQPGMDAQDGSTALPPMAPAEALTRFVLPKFRGRYQTLRVNAVKPCPDLPSRLKLQPSPGAMVEALSLSCNYQCETGAVEEEIFAVCTMYQGVPSYSQVGTMVQYNWGFSRLFSFRAPQGQLAARLPEFWSVVQSFQPNPAWQGLTAQVMQQVQAQFQGRLAMGYQNIQNANRLSQQVVAQNDAFYAQQAQRREQEWVSDHQRMAQQPAYGAFTQGDAFGDMMMGRETYNDPNYQYGSQHGYSERVWTDGQGNYVETDDVNLDPNINSDRNWTIMTKKQIGEV